MNQEQERQFFATQTKPIQRIKMNGKKLCLANLPKEMREKVIDSLASKDPVLAQGKIGILPGIKIDGKEVTRDNIHEFEKDFKKIGKEEIKEVRESLKAKVEEVKPKIEEIKPMVKEETKTKEPVKAKTKRTAKKSRN